MSETRCSKDRTLKKGGWTGLSGSAVPGWAQEKSPRLENCPPSGVGALPIGASASQCGSYAMEGARKTHKKVPPCAMSWHGWRNGPRTPFPLDPSMVHQTGDSQHGRAHVWGEYMLAPVNSPTSDRRQNCIRSWANIWLKLASSLHQCQLDPPTKAGDALVAAHHHKLESPLARPRGVEAAKQLREESFMRWSRSRVWHSHSRHRSTLHRSESG